MVLKQQIFSQISFEKQEHLPCCFNDLVPKQFKNFMATKIEKRQ